MCDPQLLFPVTDILTAGLGVALMLLPLLALRPPVRSSGETVTPTDFTTQLINLIGLGALLTVVSFRWAAVLVRAHLRQERAKR